MTPCQTIAHNMRKFRRERGWDQRELAARLGGKWTPAAVSVAERSASTQTRIKRFDADEITVLAEVLGVGITDMFAPRVPCRTCKDSPGPGLACLTCGARGETPGGAE